MVEKRYSRKDEARIWLKHNELSRVEYHDDNIVDYISSLEKLLYQLAVAGKVESEDNKKYLLQLKLPQLFHPFCTATSNNSNYD